jgi:hypothetical protein
MKVEKCDILCINCHRIETAKKQNHYMLQLMMEGN